jgi:hypothetical protein
VLPTIGRTFRLILRKNEAAEEKNTDFDIDIFFKCSLNFFYQTVKNAIEEKGLNCFPSGRIILKRVGNTDGRANKCRKFSCRPIWYL